MKKVSAFSVFNAKRKVKDEPFIQRRPPSGLEEKQALPLQRAQSSQSMERSGKKDKLDKETTGSGSRGKRILNALRASSIRESIRFSGKKSRPSSLTLIDSSSPFNGYDDRLSLEGVKNGSGDKVKGKKRILEAAGQSPKLDSTPVTRKSPRGQRILKEDTPQLRQRSAQTSTTSLKQKMPSPKIPALNFNSVSPEAESSSKSNGVDRTKLKKRKSNEMSESEGSRKKRRTEKGSKTLRTWRNGGTEYPYMYDSTLEAAKLFECIIHPVKTDRFFTELWEKKPLLVKRHTPDYNKGWFSTAEFDKILRQENIQWGVNLDATSFVNDKRDTHNLSGRAHAPVVWDMYQAGCSMRLLNPQTYSRNVWKVLSVLQEYFGCCVGANIYLTPPGTQGFAPHYDDIEAFIIQLEGKKHWKLYNPRTDEEVLPQYSSENFSQSEVGEPILDVTLEAGDLLYFPRGTIHQGNATDEHSLHITVSCYQMNSWGDLLKKLLPAAIDLAVSENVEFRTGLPRDYLNYMGIVHSEKDLPERQGFMDKVQSLIRTMMETLPLDSACDQMGRRLMHDAMPPVLSEAEKSCSVHSAGERWDVGFNRVVGVSELTPTTLVKLIRRGALRLLTEEDEVRVYYSVENARVYRGAGPNYMQVSAEMAPAVECLINAYPEYTAVESLPLENVPDQLNIVSMLYEKGLLITSEPLEITYDEPGNETEDDD
ncbi:ribosomal oxygenase 1 [Aplysia californica]|uniref:Bifunctional lysine-specific demethylase and histidyl-hydroxylase n=1 Tax=Aplysia californica TaxID=6500 RepID=A0ABM1A1V6_APLCA|nr:ribosomal oxygenase 1 [Aplysia californica]